MVNRKRFTCALTLPSLIVASEKNTNNSHVANAILPPAANFHVMGDAFSLTIPIIAIIYTFTGNVMGAHEFLLYLGYFLILINKLSSIICDQVIVYQ